MRKKPASNITDIPMDKIDEAMMKVMPALANILHEFLLSDEYLEFCCVLRDEKMPFPAEILLAETSLQVMEKKYEKYEKELGRKMPEQLEPRNMVRSYLLNPDISFSSRWKLYTKEDLN